MMIALCLALVAGAGPFGLPEPPPRPLVITEDEDEPPAFYRLPRAHPPWLALEGGIGADVRPTPQPHLPVLAFRVHGQLGASAQFTRSSPLSGVVLAGFSYAMLSEFLGTVSAGLTVPLQNFSAFTGLASWAIGTSSGQFAQGFRLAAMVTWYLVSFEVRYQQLFAAGASWASLGVSVGLAFLGGL